MGERVSREIRLKARPVGLPQESDFELAEVDVSAPAEGEVLIRNIYMSVDPYMRGRMYDRKSYVPPFDVGAVLQGGAVGEVIESLNEGFRVGDYVLGMNGWREYYLSTGSGLQKVDGTLAPLSAFFINLPPYSVEVWVFPASTAPPVNKYIVANGGETGASFGLALLICVNFGQPEWCFSVQDPLTQRGRRVGAGPISGGWTHLAATWDGSSDPDSIRLYVNGTLAATETPIPATVNTSPRNPPAGSARRASPRAWRP